jgi:hypothetical protein
VYQRSITNVWYKQLSPRFIHSGTVQSLAAFVDSVNHLLTVGAPGGIGQNPRAAWKSMIEIGSLVHDASSRYH